MQGDAHLEPVQPKRQLSLFDSTCLIAGIIIGAGIFQTAPDVARGMGTWWGILLTWLVGGVLSLFGALGYAELASAMPEEGGDYVYLTKAYGRWAGFLFGWIQLSIVRPGDIAVVSFVFATYARSVVDPFPHLDASVTLAIYAAGSIALLTVINVLGVRGGKWTQNVLTVAKVAGLVTVAVIAFVAPAPVAAAQPTTPLPMSVALILVLFTYGGWNEMVYVAAEVKLPERNIVRALVLGALAVSAIYLLVNGAFLYALGTDGLMSSQAVAADAVKGGLPHLGARLVSLLVCISALGAVNGLIFAGARISYAMGREHRHFSALGRWHARTETPLNALITQGIIALVLVVVLGSFLDAVMYTAPAVYAFYLATSLGVIVLRRKAPGMRRPYRVSGYPWTTAVFCLVCAYLVYSAVVYKPLPAVAAVVVALAGLGLYGLSTKK